MNKAEKYIMGSIMAILLIAGICVIIFGKTIAVQIGIGAMCWGVAVLILSRIVVKRNERDLNEFDEGVKIILADIAEKQELSEYYGFSIETANKARYKMQKMSRKQIFHCIALGVILIIIAIMCFV